MTDRYGTTTTFVTSPPSSPAVDNKCVLDDFSAVACDLLVPIYNSFSEGFRTADLKAAKALLERLG